MTALQLGFVGVGKMGGLMARRLLAAGHDLIVFDAVAAATKPLVEAGATAARSAREVADRANIVVASLPAPDIVRQAVLGPEGLLEGSAIQVFVDTSTTGPRVAKAVAEALEPRGVASIDCPVSGGLAGARDGKLTLMVSGSRDTVARIYPILQVLGRPIFVAETPGAAQVVKLANNLLVASAMAITAEALAMGVKAGVDPAVICDVVNTSSGRNTATADKFPRAVLNGQFDFGFSTGLAYKDVRLCLDEAEALGVPTPVGAAVRQAFAITQALHGAESDFSSIALPVEAWSGVQIRGGEPPRPIAPASGD